MLARPPAPASLFCPPICYPISSLGTTRRPVPLEHCLYYGGKLYTVAAREAFVAEGVRAAQAAWKLKNAGEFL